MLSANMTDSIHVQNFTRNVGPTCILSADKKKLDYFGRMFQMDMLLQIVMKPTDMQPNYSGKVRGWTYCGKTQRLQKSKPTLELLSPCQSATCQITKFTGCQNDRLHCWHSREYLYVHVLKNLCKKQPAEWDARSRHVVSCSPTSGSSMGSLPHGVHPQKRKLNR